MFIIKETPIFSKWLRDLRDIRGKVSILRRIERFREGNFGDSKSIGNNLYEMRIKVGAGYRVYYIKVEKTQVILLNGGDKSTQSKDIEKAKKIAKELEDD